MWTRSRPGCAIPNAVKLGAKMPNYHLSEDEINSLVAYLYSLT